MGVVGAQVERNLKDGFMCWLGVAGRVRVKYRKLPIYHACANVEKAYIQLGHDS